jgi:transposase
MPTNDLTAAELAQCYLYEYHGKTIARIAQTLHKSQTTVKEWLVNLGIYRGIERHHKFAPNEEQLLWTYGKNGVTAHSLAQHFGVSDCSVIRWLREMGIYKGRHIGKQVTETRAQPHCKVCEILLSEARDMDGEGEDGTCRFCLTIQRGLPWRTHTPREYGSDISPKVLDTLYCAREVLIGKNGGIE